MYRHLLTQKGCLDETTLLVEGTTPRFVQAMQQIFFIGPVYVHMMQLAKLIGHCWTCSGDEGFRTKECIRARPHSTPSFGGHDTHRLSKEHRHVIFLQYQEKEEANPICLQGSLLHCLTVRAHTALFSARLAFQS